MWEERGRAAAMGRRGGVRGLEQPGVEGRRGEGEAGGAQKDGSGAASTPANRAVGS